MFRREIHRKYKISELDFNARGKESNYGIDIATFESCPFELIVVKDCEFVKFISRYFRSMTFIYRECCESNTAKK